MRAVISSIEERLDAPTAKGLAQAVSRAHVAMQEPDDA